jgi:hypothetical protein
MCRECNKWKKEFVKLELKDIRNRSRIRQLEEKIDGPFGYKATVEKLTQAVYDWEQGQVLMSARIRQLEKRVGRYASALDVYAPDILDKIDEELRRGAGMEGRGVMGKCRDGSYKHDWKEVDRVTIGGSEVVTYRCLGCGATRDRVRDYYDQLAAEQGRRGGE